MHGQTVFKNTRKKVCYITENHVYVTYTLFVRVRAQLLTAFFTRPWLVKCTTFFWLRTLNKFVNILDFAGFGRPPVYSVGIL